MIFGFLKSNELRAAWLKKCVRHFMIHVQLCIDVLKNSIYSWVCKLLQMFNQLIHLFLCLLLTDELVTNYNLHKQKELKAINSVFHTFLTKREQSQRLKCDSYQNVSSALNFSCSVLCLLEKKKTNVFSQGRPPVSYKDRCNPMKVIYKPTCVRSFRLIYALFVQRTHLWSEWLEKWKLWSPWVSVGGRGELSHSRCTCRDVFPITWVHITASSLTSKLIEHVGCQGNREPPKWLICMPIQ